MRPGDEAKLAAEAAGCGVAGMAPRARGQHRHRNAPASTGEHLVDMHCHLDRIPGAHKVAAKAAELGLSLFCTTVTPKETLAAQEMFGGFPRIRVGAGMHPWWVVDGADQEERTALACELAAQSAFVGEIGLDFSGSRAASRNAQVNAFERIVAACADAPVEGRVLSIHAVRATDVVLDLLERHAMAGQSTCVFHWFSGTSDDFARLRRLGCCISVNERMLAARRGREYARQMPLDRLLLETDAPEQLDSTISAAEIRSSLERTLDLLAKVRPEQRAMIARTTAATGLKLLKL